MMMDSSWADKNHEKKMEFLPNFLKMEKNQSSRDFSMIFVSVAVMWGRVQGLPLTTVFIIGYNVCWN